jgi:hypothetical protein
MSRGDAADPFFAKLRWWELTGEVVRLHFQNCGYGPNETKRIFFRVKAVSATL